MEEKKGVEKMDGKEIMELVENKEAYNKYIECKFKELDINNDGVLSVNELQPAVSHIGLALGLPPHGSSPSTDHIYSEVLNEFTHGTEGKVSKTCFKEVLADILIGMAAGLKRDPIVILRIDGEDLEEFVNTPSFEADAVSLFSEVESSNGSLQDHIVKAILKLGVDQGLPPTSDPWVMSNIVEPAVKFIVERTSDEKPVPQDIFLRAFKEILSIIVERLKDQPVIVAHTENTYDGSVIKSLLANKFETEKVLDAALTAAPKDKHGKLSKEGLRLALDSLGPSAGLPPIGAIDEMDEVLNNVFKMVDANDGKVVKEEEFKKLLLEILGGIMLQLEGNPVSVSANSVVHEPLADSSSILTVPSTS